MMSNLSLVSELVPVVRMAEAQVCGYQEWRCRLNLDGGYGLEPGQDPLTRCDEMSLCCINLSALMKIKYLFNINLLLCHLN